MRRFLLVPVLLLALGAAGCQSGDLSKLLDVTTTSFANPVDATDIYRLKNVYAAALTSRKSYIDYCWSKPYATLMKDPAAKLVCQSRRPVVRAMDVARAKARSAINDAEAFVANNPTLNAASVIAAAWAAVTNFQNAVPV